MDRSVLATSAFEALYVDLGQRLKPETVAQRRWALNELARFAAAARRVAVTSLTVDDVLDPYTVMAWLATADTPSAERPVRMLGDAGRAAALPSQRARVASVRALAEHCGVSLPDLTLPKPSYSPAGTRSVVSALMARLGGATPDGITDVVWTRFCALAWLLVDTAGAEGQLAALSVDSFDVHAATIRWDAEQAPTRISPQGRQALLSWLEVRRQLVANLQGGTVQAMWVRAAPASAGRVVAPPGLPIGPRGLRMSWRIVIESLSDSLGTSELPMRVFRSGVRASQAAATQ